MANRTRAHQPQQDSGADVAALAAERARLKEQTRELHEAASAAREAARELRAAVKLTDQTAEATIVKIITPLCDDVTEAMKKLLAAGAAHVDFRVNHLEEVTDICIEAVQELIRNAEARMTGYESYGDIATRITGAIRDSMGDLVRDEKYMSELAELVSHNFLTSTVSPVTNKSAPPMVFRVRAPGT